MANSTIESALYTLVKCGENLISAINSVLWVCAYKGVFNIQKNFSKNFLWQFCKKYVKIRKSKKINWSCFIKIKNLKFVFVLKGVFFPNKKR